jgi:hypothetical protein
MGSGVGLATLGVDRAIALTVLNRAWGMAAGPATLVFIVAYLNPTEQGFYYAFISVLGLQVFFELGLGFVVMQTASHLMAGRHVNGSSVVGADAITRGRLGRLLADALRWYGIACIAFIALALAAGGWFLARNEAGSMIPWRLPWILVVPIFGASIVANAGFSFLEGMNLVADVALARLLQSVLGMLGLWLLLAAGLTLMSLVVLHGINLLIACVWLLRRHGALLRGLLLARAEPGAINWTREIWPFQWRIALSWIAGYCGTQAVTLILFERMSPVEAGRFGLSLTALGALASGATAWLTTKAPRFGGLVAQHRFDELNFTYRAAARAALVVGLLGILLLLMLVALLDWAQSPIADRFVPMLGLAAMGAATLASVRVATQATYLRAFRREPFLFLSIGVGILQVLMATVLAGRGNVTAVAIGYCAVLVVVGLSWAQVQFDRSRRELLA